jgi:hypothetical protein
LFYALLSFFDCSNMTKKPVTDLIARLGILVHQVSISTLNQGIKRI